MTDKYGAIVDQTGDAGDSCNFTCTAIILGMYDDRPDLRVKLVDMFWNNGRPCRHPLSGPNYSNPKNFTRDQAIPLMWCLSKEQRNQFLSDNPKRFPNTERDMPGSLKMSVPHEFYKDSRPSSITLPLKFNLWKMRFEGSLPQVAGAVIERKNYDGPDLITWDFIGMVRSLNKENYLGMPLAKAQTWLSIESHCSEAKRDKTYCDFKQLYFVAKAMNLHREFAGLHPWGLPFASHQYFVVQRNLPELHEAFLREFKKEEIHE